MPDLAKTRFVLPPDARVLGIGELSERLRTRIGPVGDGFCVVTRPGNRIAAQLIPGPLSALLDVFREPHLLTNAILVFARSVGEDPMETLDVAFDALATLVESRVLVSEASPDAAGASPSLGAGQDFDGWEIVSLVRSLDDSEVYRARRDSVTAALKISRDGRPTTAAVLANEASMLEHLAGGGSPRLVAHEVAGDRPYVAMEWCRGVSIGTVAQQARSAGDREHLHRLVSRMFDAYASLHGRGVLHGDVHPGNCLVDDDGRVVLLDFGNARRIEASTSSFDLGRSGVPHFHDPQFAEALLAGRLQPAATPASEQYAIAVLAYMLLTGLQPIDAPAVTTELLERIVSRSPRPFAARGVAAWPEVEAVLGRALARQPEDRFADVGALAAAFAAASASGAPGRPWSAAVQQVHDDQVARVLDPDAHGAPRIRVAWFALRAAMAAGDAALLAVADVHARRLGDSWAERAVVAHVARARGDAATSADAVAELLEAVKAPSQHGAGTASSPHVEAGRRLAAVAVLLADGATPGVDHAPLTRWAERAVTRHLSSSDDGDAVGTDPAFLSGALAAAASGTIEVPDGLRARLEVLADGGGGDAWLWSWASDVYAEDRFVTLAIEAPRPASPLASALMALRLHQVTGDPAFVAHAQDLVEEAHHRGAAPLDVALLVAEAQAPERAIPPPFPFA